MDVQIDQSEARQAGPQRLLVCVSQCKWRTAYEQAGTEQALLQPAAIYFDRLF